VTDDDLIKVFRDEEGKGGTVHKNPGFVAALRRVARAAYEMGKADEWDAWQTMTETGSRIVEHVDNPFDPAPAGWWEEECVRVSGDLFCTECGEQYWRHPQVAKKEAPTLVRACDGRLLKL
jgi:hypothetical protein